MSDESESIYAEYFKLTDEYREKYGEQMILLLQVGSFFEVYGMKSQGSPVFGSAISRFSEICQLVMTEISPQYKNNNIVMAGFRDYGLEKYLQKITDNGFTAVVYVQEKVGKKVKRVFHSVNSPGTYLPYEEDISSKSSNNIMCLWFEQYNPLTQSEHKMQMTCGIAVSNIFTGKSSIYEYSSGWILNPTTFDEIERCMSMYCPSELIMISPFDENTVRLVLQYSGGMRVRTIHRISNNAEKAQKCANQTYINHILSTYFGSECYNVCKEFSMNTVATQAFCYLLWFIQEHNPNLVKKISIPDFDTRIDSRLMLVNHTLKQLNIIDDNSDDGRRSGVYSSVLSLLNKCCTTMGRRRFQTHLLNPSYDENWLNSEYSMINYVMTKDNDRMMITSLRKVLRNIVDVEKICRQLVLRRIYPSTMYQLYKSVEYIQQVNICLYECPELYTYLDESPDNVNANCGQILTSLGNMFIINECANLNSTTTFPQCIISTGNSDELDALIADRTEKMQIYIGIRDALNKLIQRHGKMLVDVDYVKEHETDKLGLSLQITNKRGQILKAALDWLKLQPNPVLEIATATKTETIHARDIKVVKATTNNDEIECPLLTKTTRDILHMKDSMNSMIANLYAEFIVQFEDKYFDVLEKLVDYISKIDVLFCKAHIAWKYNYAKPMIDCSECKSYIDVKGLRHPLIEHIQINEVYVSNDICMGKDKDGMLLYGTNAVGKTSLIRSIGIAVIMAQAGMYVPCESITYKPYTAIFSRILGNDNMFKGLSTFAVEMSELRIILKMADERSLILGDELCSGTETDSALSIFVSGLEKLNGMRSTYIFATHYHEVLSYEEVEELLKERLQVSHMSVIYDREKDMLIYDRKLRDGCGTRQYGLEVCRSLYMGEEFIERAYTLRAKYNGLHLKESRYNAKKLLGACELCGKQGAEIHHMIEQSGKSSNGYKNGVRVNSVGNLCSICESCHKSLHKGVECSSSSFLLNLKKSKVLM